MKKSLLLFSFSFIFLLLGCGATSTFDKIEVDPPKETEEDVERVSIDAKGVVQEVLADTYQLTIEVDGETSTYETTEEMQGGILELGIEVGNILEFSYYVDGEKKYIDEFKNVIVVAQEEVEDHETVEAGQKLEGYGFITDIIDPTTYKIELDNGVESTFKLQGVAKEQVQLQEPDIGNNISIVYVTGEKSHDLVQVQEISGYDDEQYESYHFNLSCTPNDPNMMNELISEWGTINAIKGDYIFVGSNEEQRVRSEIFKMEGEARTDLERLGVGVGDLIRYGTYSCNGLEEVEFYEYEKVLVNVKEFTDTTIGLGGIFISTNGEYAQIDFCDTNTDGSCEVRDLKITQDAQRQLTELGISGGDPVGFTHYKKNGEYILDDIDLNSIE